MPGKSSLRATLPTRMLLCSLLLYFKKTSFFFSAVLVLQCLLGSSATAVPRAHKPDYFLPIGNPADIPKGTLNSALLVKREKENPNYQNNCRHDPHKNVAEEEGGKISGVKHLNFIWKKTKRREDGMASW